RGQPFLHDHIVSQLEFSPDSRALLAGYEFRQGTQVSDGRFFLWDVTTGEKIGGTLRHESGARRVAWSTDGKRFVTGGGREARVWDAAGTLIATLGPTDKEVRGVTFTPGGRMVLVATSKIWAEGGWRGAGDVELWDIESRQRIASLFPTDAAYDDIRFSPD